MLSEPKLEKRSLDDIRREARRLLDEARATADPAERKKLAQRAFELAQLASRIDF